MSIANETVPNARKYVDNEQIQVRVVDNKHVEYDGEPRSLTRAYRELMKLEYNVQPSPYWTFNGKRLKEIYEETYAVDDES